MEKLNLIGKLKSFLQVNCQRQSTVILAYSGGPDSTALLHLLLILKKKFNLDLHLAHVDHGWRESSKNEALFLSKEAEKLKIDFHSIRLKNNSNKNKEAEARENRLSFFAKLYREKKAQALIFAHHSDDLCETVLQRVLEGASLPFLYGMKEISKYDDLTIWRPLLGVKKNELLSWLSKKNISFFEDSTNFDGSNLRSRMRQNFFSTLIKKKVETNLLHLSSQTYELKHYLDDKTKDIYKNKVEGPFGTYLDFSSFFSSHHRVEIKYILSKIIKEVDREFSRKNISVILSWLEQNLSNKKMNFKNYYLYIDRGVLFILKKELPKLPKIQIKTGTFSFLDVDINIQKTKRIKPEKIGWKNLFKGRMEFTIPKRDCFLELPTDGGYLGRKRLKKYFSENKVPAIFRYNFCVLYEDKKIVREFLSNRSVSYTRDDFYAVTVLLK